MERRMKVVIYSDGSSRGNPGPGGFGTLLQYTDPKGVLHERELSGGFSGGSRKTGREKAARS